MVSKRWIGVVVLAAIVSIAYVDRINVSLLITNADFLQTFGLQSDRIGQGRLATLFLVGYGISAWFLTPLYEARWSVRVGLLVSIVLWVVFTGATALAGGIAVLLAMRFLLGVAEGPLFSLKTMYVKQHFAPPEVGKPNAVSSFGVTIGLAVGYPVVTFLIAKFGWQDSLWALAGLNLVIGLPLILLFIHRPADLPARVAASASTFAGLLREFLRTPHIVAILLIEVATLSYLWGASTWLPAYLRDAHHFSLSEMSIFASLPFVMGLLAQFVGGSILDRLPVRAAPIMFFGGGILTALAVTAAILIDNPYGSASAFVLAGAFWGVQGPAIPTLVQHFARPGTVGSTYGLINGVGNLTSAMMPLLMGAAMMARSTENVGRGFRLLVGSQILAAAAGGTLFWQLHRAKSVEAEMPGLTV